MNAFPSNVFEKDSVSLHCFLNRLYDIFRENHNDLSVIVSQNFLGFGSFWYFFSHYIWPPESWPAWCCLTLRSVVYSSLYNYYCFSPSTLVIVNLGEPEHELKFREERAGARSTFSWTTVLSTHRWLSSCFLLSFRPSGFFGFHFLSFSKLLNLSWTSLICCPSIGQIHDEVQECLNSIGTLQVSGQVLLKYCSRSQCFQCGL